MSAAASFRKTTQTIASLSYARLREDIMRARLVPGSKLKIGMLADAYETGPGPMREALNRLSAEGLVKQEDQKGFRVAPVSMEELQELTRTRCWVHEVALRDAIQHGDAGWEERIVVAAHRLSRSTVYLAGDETVQNPEWDVLHREFHCAIISAARSRWIRDFYALLFDAAFRYQRLSVAVPAARNVEAEHQAIVTAVLERHAEKAIILSNQHVSRTASIVEQTASLLSATRQTQGSALK